MTTVPLYIIQAIFMVFFRIFKRVNRAEHGRGANEFNNTLECEVENWYIPSGNGCFLKCVNYIFKTDFSTENFESYQHIKEKLL